MGNAKVYCATPDALKKKRRKKKHGQFESLRQDLMTVRSTGSILFFSRIDLIRHVGLVPSMPCVTGLVGDLGMSRSASRSRTSIWPHIQIMNFLLTVGICDCVISSGRSCTGEIQTSAPIKIFHLWNMDLRGD